jgi:hypothetical protein
MRMVDPAEELLGRERERVGQHHEAVGAARNVGPDRGRLHAACRCRVAQRGADRAGQERRPHAEACIGLYLGGTGDHSLRGHADEHLGVELLGHGVAHLVNAVRVPATQEHHRQRGRRLAQAGAHLGQCGLHRLGRVGPGSSGRSRPR